VVNVAEKEIDQVLTDVDRCFERLVELRRCSERAALFVVDLSEIDRFIAPAVNQNAVSLIHGSISGFPEVHHGFTALTSDAARRHPVVNIVCYFDLSYTRYRLCKT